MQLLQSLCLNIVVPPAGPQLPLCVMTLQMLLRADDHHCERCYLLDKTSAAPKQWCCSSSYAATILLTTQNLMQECHCALQAPAASCQCAALLLPGCCA
jgi:hypothetical protein